MNNGAMNIRGQVFAWTCVLNSLGYIRRGGMAGSRGNSMFSSFEGLTDCFLPWLHHCPFAPAMSEHSEFFHVLANNLLFSAMFFKFIFS